MIYILLSQNSGFRQSTVTLVFFNLCGLAMLVPIKDLNAVEDSINDDIKADAGAYMSTHDPKLLNKDCSSEILMEPTVIAKGSKAGEL